MKDELDQIWEKCANEDMSTPTFKEVFSERSVQYDFKKSVETELARDVECATPKWGTCRGNFCLKSQVEGLIEDEITVIIRGLRNSFMSYRNTICNVFEHAWGLSNLDKWVVENVVNYIPLIVKNSGNFLKDNPVFSEESFMKAVGMLNFKHGDNLKTYTLIVSQMNQFAAVMLQNKGLMEFDIIVDQFLSGNKFFVVGNIKDSCLRFNRSGLNKDDETDVRIWKYDCHIYNTSWIAASCSNQHSVKRDWVVGSKGDGSSTKDLNKEVGCER